MSACNDSGMKCWISTTLSPDIGIMAVKEIFLLRISAKNDSNVSWSAQNELSFALMMILGNRPTLNISQGNWPGTEPNLKVSIEMMLSGYSLKKYFALIKAIVSDLNAPLGSFGEISIICSFQLIYSKISSINIKHLK